MDRRVIDGSVLNLHSMFVTLDGEANGHGGAGHWSTFIRLQGCSIGCNWCDTRETWSPKDGLTYTVGEIASLLGIVSRIGFESKREFNTQRVTVTGGEPLQQPDSLAVLVYVLAVLGRRLVSIETSGYVPFRTWFYDKLLGQAYSHDTDPQVLYERVSMVVDYKVDARWVPHPERQVPLDQYHFLTRNDVIKFVVGSEDDVRKVLDMLEQQAFAARCVLSPLHGQLSPEVVYWMLKAKEWAVKRDIGLNLQMHKYIFNDPKREEDQKWTMTPL